MGSPGKAGHAVRGRWLLGVAVLLTGIARHGAAPADEAAAAAEHPSEPPAATTSYEAPIDMPLRAAGLPPPAGGVRNGPVDNHDGGSGRDAAPGSGRLGSVASRFGLVELPADSVVVTPGYRRPHHALGIHSLAAEHWLREQGVDASNCMLPMLRLHTRLQRSGTPNSALWVYARCGLH